MDRDKRIQELLKSHVLEDVLLAVNLAYTLPSEDFHEIFQSKSVDLGHYGSLFYTFYRDKKRYIFGCGKILEVTLKFGDYFDEFNNDLTPEGFNDG